MTFSRSKSLIIVLSLISLVLITVLILGVYMIRDKNRETSELLNVIDQAALTKASSQSIKDIQTSAIDEIRDFNDLVLTSDRIVPLIEDIEGSGRRLGLEVEIVSVNEEGEVGSTEPHKIRMVIETSGAWAPTYSFVRAIEFLPHRIIIDEASLNKRTDAWESRITLSLYLLD